MEILWVEKAKACYSTIFDAFETPSNIRRSPIVKAKFSSVATLKPGISW